MHCDFLGSDRLQEGHMDALKPFNSKIGIKLTMRGGFFTKFTTLAHGAADRWKVYIFLIFTHNGGGAIGLRKSMGSLNLSAIPYPLNLTSKTKSVHTSWKNLIII